MSIPRHKQASGEEIASMTPEEALIELCSRAPAPQMEVQLLSLRIQRGLLRSKAEQVSNTDQ